MHKNTVEGMGDVWRSVGSTEAADKTSGMRSRRLQ